MSRIGRRVAVGVTITATATGCLFALGGTANAATHDQAWRCTTVTDANDYQVRQLMGLLGIAVPEENVGVGLNCTPVTVVGGGNDYPNLCGTDAGIGGQLVFGEPCRANL